MKIIISGVAGFIGSNLAKALLDLNHFVIGIDNLSYGFERNIKNLFKNERFKFILGDLANPYVYREVQGDVFVHLASQKIPRYGGALRTIDENYLILKNVVSKCLLDKTKIVFASTSDVYGKNENIPFSETSNFVLGDSKIKRWSYALSKLYGEHYIISNSDEYGLIYSIARFFGTYGINQNLTWWGGPQSVFINAALEKKSLEIHGDGTQTRTFTYIDDNINELRFLIEDKSSDNEIFNVAGNPADEIAIINLAEMIWKKINPNVTIKLSKIPYSTFGKYEDVLRRVPNIDKIKQYSGYSPRFDLSSGLDKTIKWQKRILR